MIWFTRTFHSLLNCSMILLVIVAILVAPNLNVHADNLAATPELQASTYLDGLTPEERVGQLFLVTFQGTDVGPESLIYNLVTQHNIGGVVLLSKNDNFISVENVPEETPQQAVLLINQLQQNKWEYSQDIQVDPETGETNLPAYVPLFVGIPQEGDGYPYDQILHGLTTLPTAMSLGATWNPDLAAQTGEILGKELSSLGFNLLLGPSLDVLESPQLESTDNLGTRTFGGDPFWVAQMGRAYIQGVHTGSSGKIAVVAKHFPGHGSSDRLPEVEVATVRKSLDELKSFDLAPFFEVTGRAQSPEETVDALLVSHIRYQGLQGNIRATTRPVSLDPQAFNLLKDLPELNSWRESGGLMVSDDLGSLAVRRFYDLTSQTFEARRVALNAFLAGNDLLYIADFSSNQEVETDEEGEEDPSYVEAVRTLEFFAQKYREDTAFAQRVDESVLRILTLKFRLFQNFTLGNVLSTQGNLGQLGQSDQFTFEVARQSATLISPTQAELDENIPDPPNQNDRIVIISETRTAKQCSECPAFPILDVNALQDAVIRLYGPQAGGQMTIYNTYSYPLTDLQEMLDTDPIVSPLERDLGRAQWIVFAMLNPTGANLSYNTLRQFLTERADLFQQKNLIVFSFNAPYFLDATNISKLTAYYGLYSKSSQFMDMAAYLLFQELRTDGAPPVSINGISYDINRALFPDPEQTIPLVIDYTQPETTGDQATPSISTPEPTPAPEFRIGDVIQLKTGVIFDYNGNPVPDGTPVNFIFTMGGETSSVRQVETTRNGLAQTTYAVSVHGTLEIIAESENARSEILRIDIPPPSGEAATITPSETPTEIPERTSTATEENVEATTPTSPPPPGQPGFSDWLIAIFVSGAIASIVYRLSSLVGQVRWGVRASFLSLIGGLLAYSYLALQMPGSERLLENSVSLSVILGTFMGTILGLFIAFSWRTILAVGQRISSTD